MTLRPYQRRAVDAVSAGWAKWRKQLGVAATGAGKTIIFSHLAAAEPGRTLILAHREELVNQAVQKLHAATGIAASVEQGASRAMPGHGVIVASVQSMRNRLEKYSRDAFDLVICDEAHHVPSEEWQCVLSRFESARVLGVTATPDRADRRSLGGYFQNIAFEIGLMELISSGHLCGLRALRLDIDLSAKHLRLKGRKDLSNEGAAELITPQLDELARVTASEIWDRKTLGFLPRRDVSGAFAVALRRHGIDARHVDGESLDREELLEWFAKAGRGSALCNPMFLTEGYDLDAERLGLTDIDCILPYRATKNRSMFMQEVGRGMRVGCLKDFCLVLDPFWICGDIDLCRLADLVAGDPLTREKLQARLDEGLDMEEAEVIARKDVEEALAEKLKEAQKDKKAPRGMVDPLAWSIGIHDSDLETYEAAMPWEMEPPTAAQKAALGKWKVWQENMTAGFAAKLLARIEHREALGLATPAQVMLLRQFGNPNADIMTKEQAGYFIGLKMRRAA